MLNTERNCLPENNSIPQTKPAVRNTARTNIHDFSAEELKDSLLATHEPNCPLEELIATGEATFEFIRSSGLEMHSKNAFAMLERQFEFYRRFIKRRYY